MTKFTTKLATYFVYILILAGIAFVNFSYPLYELFEDTALYRFIWLGIFFVLIDFLFEIFMGASKQVVLLKESFMLGASLKKMSANFHLISNFKLPNGARADYILIGSSGVWLLTVIDDDGKISFNGDDLVRENVVLKGLLARSLEKSFSLANIIKDSIKRNIVVSPVIVFSNNRAVFDSIPKSIRGVYIIAGKDAASLIENTDAQLIDKNTIEEIGKILKK